MNCFRAIMSIKPVFDPHLNEYIFSFPAVEIVSVISLTEHIHDQRCITICKWNSRNTLSQSATGRKLCPHFCRLIYQCFPKFHGYLQHVDQDTVA